MQNLLLSNTVLLIKYKSIGKKNRRKNPQKTVHYECGSKIGILNIGILFIGGILF